MSKTENYWLAVMIGGSLEPHLNTDGYAGYGCPNFKSKADCENGLNGGIENILVSG